MSDVGRVRAQIAVRGERGAYFVVLRQIDGSKTEETFFGPYGRSEVATDFAMALQDQLKEFGGVPTQGTS